MSSPKLESDGFSAPQSARLAAAATVSDARIVVTQAALVASGAMVAGGVAGSTAFLSSLWGGGAALAGTAAFAAVRRWRSQPAPTPWQALRAVVVAEVAKWAVSLCALAGLLSGAAGVEAVARSPGAAVVAFCLAWVAPPLAWLTVPKHNA